MLAKLKEIKHKKFANGIVYLLETEDGFPIEVTDTFLPYYTKDAIGRKQNSLKTGNLGSRSERWMIGVSVMSGCPVGCKFCATGKLKKCRNLTWEEIVAQVQFVVDKHFNGGYMAKTAKEFKINYTRMGEPFLNIDNVKRAISWLDAAHDAPRPIMSGGLSTHHYVSTIGIEGSDFDWVFYNVTLQLSVHSFDELQRDWLIPYPHKMKLKDMGQIRTDSSLKTTINMTMARQEDFDIKKLTKWFDPKYFFVKISPINENDVSTVNGLGSGIISQINLA